MGDTTIKNVDFGHSPQIVESFVAVEATCPPAEVRGRDDGPARIHLAR